MERVLFINVTDILSRLRKLRPIGTMLSSLHGLQTVKTETIYSN